MFAIATSQQMAFTDMLRTRRVHFKPPIDDIEKYWKPHERAPVTRMLARSAVASRDTVRDYIKGFVDGTGADELMVATDVYDLDARLCSIELQAEITAG
ncbi:hypothetical protein [Rhizobium sp. 768_B6_N1_8]|uniref:hypothetical protein n=1 Tax=unclassified Rhizobium TaxID=2613769 RepID=UPI003F1FD896